MGRNDETHVGPDAARQIEISRSRPASDCLPPGSHGRHHNASISISQHDRPGDAHEFRPFGDESATCESDGTNSRYHAETNRPRQVRTGRIDYAVRHDVTGQEIPLQF